MSKGDEVSKMMQLHEKSMIWGLALKSISFPSLWSQDPTREQQFGLQLLKVVRKPLLKFLLQQLELILLTVN